MSTDRITLEVEAREVAGTSGAKAVRRQGKIPGVFYGNGREAVAVAVESRVIREAVHAAGGRHAIFDVKLAGAGKAVPAIIKDIQLHPTRDTAIHFDLYEVNMRRSIQAPVTVLLVGEPVGVKMFGGMLSQASHEVICEALPDDLPEHIEVDITEMNIGDVVRLADLSVPEGVTVVGDADLVIAAIAVPRGLTAEEEAGVEEPAAEGGAEAEGDADASAGGDAPTDE